MRSIRAIPRGVSKMTRFIAVCVLGAGACVVAMVFLGQALWGSPDRSDRPGRQDGKATAPGQNGQAAASATGGKPAGSVDDDKPVVVMQVAAAGGGPRALIIMDARVLPSERQDVPAEREGKLLFLATEAGPAERIPEDKLITYDVSILAVSINESEWLKTALGERIVDPRNPGRHYRRVLPDDELTPGTTTIVRQTLRFRKLEVGDHVHKGQLLGLINPALALEDLSIKQAKVEAADADALATAALKEESKRRLDSIVSLRTAYKRAVTDDDYGVARVTVERYKH